MHQKGMSHWLWTWRAWGKDKYGLMGRVLGDTGLLSLMVIATNAIMLEALNPQSVNSVADNPLNDGKMEFVKDVIACKHSRKHIE